MIPDMEKKILANGVRYLGDCFEIIPELPHKYDLLLTDPPYAIPSSYYKTKTGHRRWSDTLVMSRWFYLFIEVVRGKLKPKGVAGVFCDTISSAVFTPVLYEQFSQINHFVWDKGFQGPGKAIQNQHELFVFGIPSDFSLESPHSRSTVITDQKISPNKRRHPVEKPLHVLVEIIGRLCPEGGRILDPFAGSGSTYEAAKTCGRYCDLIEYDERDSKNQDTEQELLGL